MVMVLDLVVSQCLHPLIHKTRGSLSVLLVRTTWQRSTSCVRTLIKLMWFGMKSPYVAHLQSAISDEGCVETALLKAKVSVAQRKKGVYGFCLVFRRKWPGLEIPHTRVFPLRPVTLIAQVETRTVRALRKPPVNSFWDRMTGSCSIRHALDAESENVSSECQRIRQPPHLLELHPASPYLRCWFSPIRGL